MPKLKQPPSTDDNNSDNEFVIHTDSFYQYTPADTPTFNNSLDEINNSYIYHLLRAPYAFKRAQEYLSILEKPEQCFQYPVTEMSVNLLLLKTPTPSIQPEPSLEMSNINSKHNTTGVILPGFYAEPIRSTPSSNNLTAVKINYRPPTVGKTYLHYLVKILNYLDQPIIKRMGIYVFLTDYHHLRARDKKQTYTLIVVPDIERPFIPSTWNQLTFDNGNVPIDSDLPLIECLNETHLQPHKIKTYNYKQYRPKTLINKNLSDNLKIKNQQLPKPSTLSVIKQQELRIKLRHETTPITPTSTTDIVKELFNDRPSEETPDILKDLFRPFEKE